MNARLALLILSLCGTAQAAEELPRSPACRTALAALEQAEEALAAAGAASSAAASDRERQHAVTAKLQPLRQRVADACLGGMTTSPPPSQHTWVMPPTPARPALTPRAAVTPPVIVPTPRLDPPVTVNTCAGATCIASDGSMLQRVGPNLIGPRGVCTKQGIFVVCP